MKTRSVSTPCCGERGELHVEVLGGGANPALVARFEEVLRQSTGNGHADMSWRLGIRRTRRGERETPHGGLAQAFPT